MPKQNKKVCDPVYLLGVNGRAEEAFSVEACYKSGLLLQFNSVESSGGKVVEKSESMKPIVREVGADSYLQNKRMRRCEVGPPPIIFERLKLPQQIIYRRKENLSESPNHQKYWENILVSRFYEQLSRNRRNLGHFRKFEKISNSQNMNILYIILKHVIWRFQIYNLFREIFKFREDKSNNVFREIRKCFRKTAENGLNSAYFAIIAHKIAKPKYFPNIFDDSDSPINSLSDDI